MTRCAPRQPDHSLSLERCDRAIADSVESLEGFPNIEDSLSSPDNEDRTREGIRSDCSILIPRQARGVDQLEGMIVSSTFGRSTILLQI